MFSGIIIVAMSIKSVLSGFSRTRFFSLACLVVVAAAIVHRMSATGTVDSFELASWNMRWFPSGYMKPQEADRELERINRAARLVREQGRIPDVFFAQEIRDMKTCVAFASRLNDPAFKPIVCSSFTETADRTNSIVGLQQVAIFSRFKALESGAEPWHTKDFVTPPRGYAYAVLEVGTNLVAVFNVHLKSNFIPKISGGKAEQEAFDKQQFVLNRLKRELSCRQLLDAVAEIRKNDYGGRRVSAVVLGGDFNHSVYDDRFAGEDSTRAILSAGFINVFAGRSGEEWATLPPSQWYPYAIFDYVFADGLSAAEGTQRVLKEHRRYGMSDHRQIRARLSFPGPAGNPALP